MKQFLLLMLTIIAFYYAVGQEDVLIIKESTKINRQLIPGPVIDSLNKLFPKAMPIEYYAMSPASAKNAWAVAGADSLVSYRDSTDYYLIVIKKTGIKFYSLFSANGMLTMTKLKENVTYLPGTVRESMKVSARTILAIK